MACVGNCSAPGLEVSDPHGLDMLAYLEYQPWFFSLLGSAVVGLSGVLPLLVIRIDEESDLKHGASAGTLKILLSFAVGGLLGDVFLHLLPEAWANNLPIKESKAAHPPLNCGLWVLAGFLVFIIAEKIFSYELGPDEPEDLPSPSPPEERILENNNCIKPVLTKNGYVVDQTNGLAYKYDPLKPKNGYANGYHVNGYAKENLELKAEEDKAKVKIKPKLVSGYLNLLANCIDNFTHGLAVGGSFLISFRLGALTTFAILVHEIPHEIGDFAILLKSGFNKWDAAKAQMLTATGGVLGALVAVFCTGDGIDSKTSWILPFTAGGFLHIGLVSILPELLKETSPKESFKQLGAIIVGITLMAMLTIVCD